MATKVTRAEIAAFKLANPDKYAEMMAQVKYELENGIRADNEPPVREIHKCNTCANGDGCMVSCECITKIFNGHSGSRWHERVPDGRLM